MACELHSSRRHCPACGSRAGLGRGEKNGFHLLSCQSCETLYTGSLPDLSSAQNYDACYHSEALSTPAFVHQRLDQIVAGFSPYRQTNRLLEVGFGAGSLLQATTRAGWSTEGVEVSQTAFESARGMGFKVFRGELSEAQYPTGHFDVVLASEVLEHVPDPQALVREIARVLRRGGLLWATTPHGRGASARILSLKWSVISPPEHLQLFSRSGMKMLLKTAGFGQVRMATQGINPFEIWHALRPRHGTNGEGAGDESFNRVETGQQLNALLSESPSRRALKGMLNGLLDVSRLGDSLKIWAEN